MGVGTHLGARPNNSGTVKMPPMLFPVVALAVLCLYSDGSVEIKEPGPIGRADSQPHGVGSHLEI